MGSRGTWGEGLLEPHVLSAAFLMLGKMHLLWKWAVISGPQAVLPPTQPAGMAQRPGALQHLQVLQSHRSGAAVFPHCWYKATR